MQPVPGHVIQISQSWTQARRLWWLWEAALLFFFHQMSCQDTTSQGSCHCCVLTGREKKPRYGGHSPCAQCGRLAGASRPGDAAQTIEHPLLEHVVPVFWVMWWRLGVWSRPAPSTICLLFTTRCSLILEGVTEGGNVTLRTFWEFFRWRSSARRVDDEDFCSAVVQREQFTRA